ncbi:hypothetical protein FS837_003899 [Tulasnella sp. UAMH 9824]|nr:hypothetical protein FS837_003899 [Tulasnella sp. UAMH 9824]
MPSAFPGQSSSRLASAPSSSKARQPSTAWFLGAAPPGKSSATSSQIKGVVTCYFYLPRHLKETCSHKMTGPSSKAASTTFASTNHKLLSSGKPKAAIAKPPKSAFQKTRGPLAPRKSSPKKRRKLDITPSPPPNGASSLNESSEDEYLDYSTTSRPKAQRTTTAASRGRGGYVPTGLGRPVGLGTLPTFVPKPFSSASESSQDDSDGVEASNAVDLDDVDDDDLDEDDDIMKEEERMILQEERKRDKNRRRKKETDGSHRHHQSKKDVGRVDNDIFMNSDLTSLSSSSSSSSSSGSASDSDPSASSGEEEDDEADEEADEDDDPMDLAEDTGVWSDSSDETDANLFFTNFLGSDDSGDEEEKGPKDKSSDNDESEPAPLYASFATGPREGIFVDAGQCERGQQRHSRRRRKRSASADDGRGFIVAEDPDGRLVIAADGWEGARLDTEWEKAQAGLLVDDEEVTSEESEIEGGDPVLLNAANADDDEESEGTTTETDFDGNTTFDEGLDEDGLPPSMAYLSQQHQSEQEFNLRRLRQEQAVDIPLPLPDHLRTGVELFQGGYATVMFGKFDFPAAAPSVMTSSGHLVPPEFAEVWEGIKDVESLDEEETDEEQPMLVASPEQIKTELYEAEVIPSTDQIVPSENALASLEIGIPAAADHQVPQVPSPTNEGNPPQPEDHPPTPPRKLPVMGSFRRSPPSPEKAFVESSHPPAVIAPEHSLLVSPITEKPPVNMFSSVSTISSAGDPPPSASSATSATPAPLQPKRMVIIDGKSDVVIPSPFSTTKRKTRRKITSTEESDGSISVGQRSDFFFSSHVGFGSWDLGQTNRPRTSRSARSSFSQPFPPPLFSPIDAVRTPLPTQFTPGPMPPPPPLSAPIDLTDVLDPSFLSQEGPDGANSGTTADEEDTMDQSTLKNLNRWKRVPMGTFRHARAFGSIGNEGELHRHHPPESPRTSDGFSYGATPTGPPVKSGSALWSDGIEPPVAAASKGKAKATVKPRGRKIIISPALLPIKDEEGVPEVDEMDVELIPGIKEEEGYFSRKQYKGGREGTERERLKRKFEEKERRSQGHGVGPKPPLHNRVKTGSAAPVSPQMISQ